MSWTPAPEGGWRGVGGTASREVANVAGGPGGALERAAVENTTDFEGEEEATVGGNTGLGGPESRGVQE